MPDMPIDYQTAKAFGSALAIGLLIGVERYKSRGPDDRKSTGARTFTVISLLGAVCRLLDHQGFTLATFAALAALLGLGYYRESVESLGSTTELTALLTFWLGYLARDHQILAVSSAVVLVILLASKRALHGFVKVEVSDLEFFDTLKFLAVVFVVFPLLPDRAIGPYGFFNPAQAWMLVILVSTISYSGYVLIRLLGGQRGLAVNALVGGVVSTTAVTMSLATRARQAPELARLCGVTGVLANAVQFPRLLVLIWAVDRGLAGTMAVPLLGMFVAGLIGAWFLGRWHREPAQHPALAPALENPYSFWPACKFALLFLGVFLLAKAATVWLGEQGIYLASALAGLVDASAISMSVADMAHAGSLQPQPAAIAILIAVTANAAVKWILAATNGTRDLAFWLGGGFLTMLGTGVVLTFAMGVL